MRRVLILGSILLLSGCVSANLGGGTVQELSDQYNSCVLKGINAAYGSGTKGNAAIDQAIVGCREIGKNYGTKLAADVGVDSGGQWEVGITQMLPEIEKKSRAYFQDYLKRHGG